MKLILLGLVLAAALSGARSPALAADSKAALTNLSALRAFEKA